MVTLRASCFMEQIEKGGKAIFEYEFWNKIQKEIESGLLLNDNGNLYKDTMKN